MARNDDTRTLLLTAEISRLEGEIVILNRQWSQKHWLLLVGLAAIPMMFMQLRPLWIGLTLLGGPALVATQAYLLAVRRAECRMLIEYARRDRAIVQERNSRV